MGFLPSFELSNRRRPPSFSAWAQENGFAINRKLKSSVASATDESAKDSEGSEGTEKIGGADEEYKRLLDLYSIARTDLLSALVGEVNSRTTLPLSAFSFYLMKFNFQVSGQFSNLAFEIS